MNSWIIFNVNWLIQPINKIKLSRFETEMNIKVVIVAQFESNQGAAACSSNILFLIFEERCWLLLKYKQCIYLTRA